MTEFKSLYSYQDFAQEVRGKSRYFWTQKTHDFLEALKDSWTDREFILRKDDRKGVWRAQKGCDWDPIYDNEGDHVDDDPAPYAVERMIPRSDKASEGRANPKGIPMLYAATNRKTAVAEMRPGVGDQVSVAQLLISNDLTLINCSKHYGKRNTKIWLGGNPPAKEIVRAVWTDIDNAFAKPITPNDETADYIPTQILAEYFKNNGFDGIVFKSSVAAGHNLVVFNPSLLEVGNRQVVEINKVNYKFQWSGGDRFKDLDSKQP
jgi:RES domain-containing protein